jgi:TFIIF-interacting CTD phosphatase-like protein
MFHHLTICRQQQLLKYCSNNINSNVPVGFMRRVMTILSSVMVTQKQRLYRDPLHQQLLLLQQRHFSSSSSSSSSYPSSKQQWMMSGRVCPTMNKRRLQFQPTTSTATSTATVTPYIMNGKIIPFHIKDLHTIQQQKHQYYHNDESLSTSSSSPPSLVSYQVNRNSIDNNNNNNNDKLTVVLDLDECLVHSRFLYTSLDAAIYTHQLLHYQQAQQQQQINSDSNINTNGGSGTYDSFRMVLSNVHSPPTTSTGITLQNNDPIHVHVFIRPGCIEFLSHVISLYDTYIYTAAISVYANPILDYLSNAVQQYNSHNSDTTTTTISTTATASTDNDSIFRGRFYREHCIYDPTTKQYFKDLSLLHTYNHQLDTNIPSQINKMVLIDNNPISLMKNPNNGILVDSFYGPFHPSTDINKQNEITATDNTFDNVLQYLNELSNANDVRPIIETKNKMIMQQSNTIASSTNDTSATTATTITTTTGSANQNTTDTNISSSSSSSSSTASKSITMNNNHQQQKSIIL